MNRHIIDINDFTVLVEESTVKEHTIDSCTFGVAFYGSGNVKLAVKYGE